MIAFLRRGLFAVLALSLVLGANVRPIEAQTAYSAQENSRYAAIVIDAATGEVLFARNADSLAFFGAFVAIALVGWERISAIMFWCRIAPPMSCTSKCTMFQVSWWPQTSTWVPQRRRAATSEVIP